MRWEDRNKNSNISHYFWCLFCRWDQQIFSSFHFRATSLLRGIWLTRLAMPDPFKRFYIIGNRRAGFVNICTAVHLHENIFLCVNSVHLYASKLEPMKTYSSDHPLSRASLHFQVVTDWQYNAKILTFIVPGGNTNSTYFLSFHLNTFYTRHLKSMHF